MCGIFGFAYTRRPQTVHEILNVLLDGLSKVEYRGYDSAGLAVDESSANAASGEGTPETILVRSVGNISQLRSAVEMVENAALDVHKMLDRHVGLAHTRWATHGGVSIVNCHPHQSPDGSFTIVHNGIVSNFFQKKEELLRLGYSFKSNTDTEVVAVLLQHIYDHYPGGSPSFKAVMEVLAKEIEGAYALLVKSTHFPNELYGFRIGSPLVIGAKAVNKSSGEAVDLTKIDVSTLSSDYSIDFFFASDCNSFLQHTRYATYLDDGDLVHWNDGKLEFFKCSEESGFTNFTPTFECLTGDLTLLSKGNYPTFMMKEVMEQTESVVSTMKQRIDFAARKVSLSEITEAQRSRILTSRRVLLIGCGTSYHSCLAVRPLLEEVFMPVSVDNASDFLDRKPKLSSEETCILVSQSGETADVLQAMKHVKQCNAFTVGLTNVKGSSIARLSDCSLLLHCGAEVGVASTKAYTSQVVLLHLLALFLSAPLAEKDDAVKARRLEVIQGLSTITLKLGEALKCCPEPIERLAKHLKNASSIMVIGRGYDYASALEAALKIKELSYVHTEGVHSGELKHGPLALVDETLDVVSFCSDDKYFDKSMNAISQIQARGGRPVIITSSSDERLLSNARGVLVLPKAVDSLQCIINAVPAQLLAYYMAVHKGNNVDCPRNLAKSVTVE